MFHDKMKSKSGYIYVRCHPSYETSCKIGKTDNIPDRDSQYATGEIKRGYFEEVFEVTNMGIVERLLQIEFKKFNVKYDAGTEFYDKKVIQMIEPYLKRIGIKYKRLTNQEINNLLRRNRVKKTMKKINIQSLIRILKSYIPRKDQKIIIEKSVTHFQKYDKGILVLMCGVGKTLISLWITQKLKLNRILIGVPNILLLKQWKKVIGVLFENIPCLMVSSGIEMEHIISFIENNKECIVITTYSSSHKVYRATQNSTFVFGMKILDEVHHLTSMNIDEKERKTYVKILNVPSIKQLSLTATLKHLESTDDKVVSNDNAEYFGVIIDRKCLLWAIKENIICDYVIQTLETNEESLENHLHQFNIIDENDKRMFFSAYAALKSIHTKHSHHILIYSNNKNNSLKLIQYIKLLLDNKYFIIDDLYYSNYHSDMNVKDQVEIIDHFKKKPSGIIACIYCLGEGWDFPLLDGVVFAENMSSNIRIVQSALRPIRKNKEEPNKITKIILPILYQENNPDLKKVREVIYQMGLEDETIIQKIKGFRIGIAKHAPPEKGEPLSLDDFGEYDEELTKRIRLNTINRASLDITYEKARKIIADKHIKSKEEYYELCDKDNRLSKDPERIFKGQFTNWIDYLSIERRYYDLKTCKSKINELFSCHLKRHHLELSNVMSELSHLDEQFPPNGLWVEYYNVKSLEDIITIPNKKKNIQLLV